MLRTDSSPRPAAVAGRFYPGDAQTLGDQVDRLLASERLPEPALALVAPHAGYIYSGEIAGATWARVSVPRRVILLCPNHTGLGSRRSLWSGGAWQIPGAQLPVDQRLREAIPNRCEVELDLEAHALEHAIEVHLPLLHRCRPDAEIVPICLGRLDGANAMALGEGLATAVSDVGGDVLLVASTDMSHYISATAAAHLDKLALDRVRALDPVGLDRVVRERGITMCGVVPTVVALAYALARGARSVEFVAYGNSGATSGDFARVVGYAGLIIR